MKAGQAKNKSRRKKVSTEGDNPREWSHTPTQEQATGAKPYHKAQGATGAEKGSRGNRGQGQPIKRARKPCRSQRRKEQPKGMEQDTTKPQQSNAGANTNNPCNQSRGQGNKPTGATGEQVQD